MPVRRPTLLAIALAAAAALGALVAPRVRDASDGGRIAAVGRPAPAAPAAASGGAAPIAGGPVVKDDAPSADVLPEAPLPASLLTRRWQRHARAAVDQWIAATPHADTVSAADRDALVDALGELRRAALASRRRDHDGIWQARHGARIAAADRVFRDTLGSGLSEFLAAVSAPEHVVDLGAAPR